MKHKELVLIFQREVWRLNNKEQVEIPTFRSNPPFKGIEGLGSVPSPSTVEAQPSVA